VSCNRQTISADARVLRRTATAVSLQKHLGNI